MVWKPVATKLTESPTWMVTPCGKKLSTSELCFSKKAFWSFSGTPMSTARVAACADTGAARALAVMAAASADFVRPFKDISLSRFPTRPIRAEAGGRLAAGSLRSLERCLPADSHGPTGRVRRHGAPDAGLDRRT